MAEPHRRTVAKARTFLGKLLRDARANTVTIMAISIIPLAGMVGGGVDLSRMYIVKTRLQHACDAGALAGRKSMGGGTWTQNNHAPRTEAERFFNANIQASPYGATSLTRSYTENAGKVTGTASAVVPMTLMRIFGRTTETLSVTCDAEMRLPNTDVMFVLDTTKSMECAPSDAQVFCNTGVAASQKRITALRIAVKCFFEIVARLDTNANCVAGAPSGGTGDQVQIRFGFVPYATNVNVGKLLPNNYLASNWNYQSRVARPTETVRAWTTGTAGSPSMTGSWSTAPSDINNQSTYSSWTDRPTSPANVTINGTSYAVRRDLAETNCNALNTIGPSGNRMLAYTESTGNPGTAYENGTGAAPVYPATTQTVPYRQNRTNTVTGHKYRFVSGQSGSNRCRLQSGTRTYTAQRDGSATRPVTWETIERFTGWNYRSVSHDVSDLKAGTTNWNSSITAPIGLSSARTVRLSGSNSNTSVQTVTDVSVTWNGCIEERQTVQTTNFNPIPSGARDLDIDLVPNSDATRWKPVLPRLIFTRSSTSGQNVNATSWSGTNTSGWNNDPHDNTTNDYRNGISYACPTEARKLQQWSSGSDFDSYVDSLVTDGATYHDIGLLWGARLMSPTGIFASENAFTPQGGEIERHLIFMTDGDTNANDYDYAAYGVPFFDRRQTNGAPTKAQLDEQVDLRFLAICNAVRNKNITLWVVSFGAAVNTATQTRLQNCATPGRFFNAADATALQNTFRSIADQISQLRLTG